MEYKLLRNALEVVETATADKDSMDTTPGEFRPILKLGEQIGQLDVGFFEDDWRRSGNPGCLYARSIDGYVRFAPQRVS